MSMINYASREINCKLVYYGPGLGGKTTNLEHIYAKVSPNTRGKMISLATETERTLFFDFLPVDLGTRSEEHTSELQSQSNLVCRLLLEKKKSHTPPRRSPPRNSVPQPVLRHD